VVSPVLAEASPPAVFNAPQQAPKNELASAPLLQGAGLHFPTNGTVGCSELLLFVLASAEGVPIVLLPGWAHDA